VAALAAGAQVSLDGVSRPVDPAATRAIVWPVRLARSVAAALVCTLTAALGHLAGGGVIPTEMALMAFLGSALVAWSLSARRVTASQLIGLLVLCQVCVHLSSTSMNMSALMVTTHIIATIASAALLTYGEAFVWRLAEHLGLRAVPELLRVGAVPAVRPIALVHRQLPQTDVFLAYTRLERGPPIAS
jgi:hypothetical protein